MIELFEIILGIVVVIILVSILIYNRLIVLRNNVENAWAQIDVQLKRRADLIPNLVSTVKGYMKHERETLENITKARAAILSAKTPREAADADNMLTAALKSLFAVAENYPNLRASENFLRLQEDLSDTENKIAYARQLYNDSVLLYNRTIQSIPNNIIAALLNFKEKEYFRASEEEKKAVEVKF
ncbi:MAG: LemA family protein [Candidatus Micrarchaeota archaeon]|nr:LemA family protein [Candidatus Micrarchaeota archaeon]